MGVDVSDNFHQIYLFKYRRSHVKLKHGPSFPTLILPIWPMSSSPVQESLDSWLPNGGPLKLLSRYKKTSWIILFWLGVAMQLGGHHFFPWSGRRCHIFWQPMVLRMIQPLHEMPREAGRAHSPWWMIEKVALYPTKTHMYTSQAILWSVFAYMHTITYMHWSFSTHAVQQMQLRKPSMNM